MRTLDEIRTELAIAANQLRELQQERDRLRIERYFGIVADFDAGLGREAIAEKWEVSYGQVGNILHKAGRSERSRHAIGLTAEQRQHYEAALHQGVSPQLARRIAKAVGS